MPIQSEIIYPESIMAHLTSFEFCPVFGKNRAKVRLCVCSGVLIMVTYGQDRFFVTVTSRMDIIHDVTKWAVHLCFSGMNGRLHGLFLAQMKDIFFENKFTAFFAKQGFWKLSLWHLDPSFILITLSCSCFTFLSLHTVYNNSIRSMRAVLQDSSL